MNYTEFDKKCKCGPEFVCVRIIEKCDQLKVGNVWLPGNAAANGRLAHCIIEDVGSVSAEKYGLMQSLAERNSNPVPACSGF